MPSLCAVRVGRRVGRSAAQHRRERRRFDSTSAAAAAALAPLRAVGRHLRESPEGVQQLLRLCSPEAAASMNDPYTLLLFLISGLQARGCNLAQPRRHRPHRQRRDAVAQPREGL